MEQYEDDTDGALEQGLFTTHISAVESVQPVVLNHIIMSKKCLRRTKAKSSEHPRVSFELSRAGTDRYADVRGVADSGAQSNLCGVKDFEDAGFKLSELSPVQVKVRAANKNPINVLGAFHGVFKGIAPDGEVITCEGTVFVSDSVDGFYLSYDTMVDLLILSNNFPMIGEFKGSDS